jgi:hypothetical protein
MECKVRDRNGTQFRRGLRDLVQISLVISASRLARVRLPLASTSRRRPGRSSVPDLLQDHHDGARGLADAREQFGERLTQGEGLAALVLGRKHVVD